MKFHHRWVAMALFIALSALGLAGCSGGSGGGDSGSNSPALAVNALSATGPIPADSGDRSGELLLTRLSVTLASDATTEQLNAAMAKVGATGIGFSKPGSPSLTLIVPRQENGAKLAALAQLLQSQPGILFAAPGRQMSAFYLPMPAPATPADSEMRHLLAARFPAAWNAAFSATGQRLTTARNCTPAEATVIIADFFQSVPSDPNNQLAPFSGAQRFGAFNAGPNEHGWQVAATLASAFDELIPTGATPLTDCVDFVLVDISGLTYTEIIAKLQQSISAQLSFSRLIVNLSFGFGKKFCGPNVDDVCTAEHVATTPAGMLESQMSDRIMAAIQWAEFTNNALDERMLLVQAAGNEAAYLPENGGLGVRYTGIRQADLASPIALATRLESLNQLFSPESELAASYWNSEGQPSLLLSPASFQHVQNQLAQRVTRVPSKANLIVVGSATNPESGLPADIVESSFSNEGSALLAVGENVVGLGTSSLPLGTSYAAPQVSGLAAYLWSISDLEDRPASETATHIKSTTTPKFLLDAYAATLALDAMATLQTVGIREALMDVNGDDVFDDKDLQEFATAYGLGNPNTPSIPESRDYGRFDLNGDGATGGIPTYYFDLDRSSIIPGPASVYSSVDRVIEGYTVSFNEAALSDIQALCYYAYSTLYANDNPSPAQKEARTAILGPDRCVFAKMYANFPAQITGATPLNVKVEVPAGSGQYAPAPNMLVSFTPSCGSVSPGSGRTDAEGNVTTTVTPTGCSAAVSVTAVARANEGTTPLVQQTVTATVAGALSTIQSLGIDVGGHTPGIIEAWRFPEQDIIVSGPVSEAAAVMAQVQAALAGVSELTGTLTIYVYEPVSLALNLAIPVGTVTVGGQTSAACGSSLNVTVGDVALNAGIGGCLGNVTLTTGNIGRQLLVQGTDTVANITVGTVEQWVAVGSSWFADTASNLTATIHTQAFSSLSIWNTRNTTINISGTMQRQASHPASELSMKGNSNLTLGAIAGGTLNTFYIETTSFASPPSISVGNIAHPGSQYSYPTGSVDILKNTGLSLGSISMGNIDGNLSIKDNRGFSNTDATAFANARTVGGTRSISGNY